MLNLVKKSIRITHDSMDDEIKDMIAACKKDLLRVGVKKIDEKDPLIKEAIKLYAKSRINFEGQGDKYEIAYNALRDGLSLSGDYNV